MKAGKYTLNDYKKVGKCCNSTDVQVTCSFEMRTTPEKRNKINEISLHPEAENKPKQQLQPSSKEYGT